MTERIIKKGKCKNTDKDKLKLINSVLSANVKIHTLLGFPSVVFFSVSALQQEHLDKFVELSGFALEDVAEVVAA